MHEGHPSSGWQVADPTGWRCGPESTLADGVEVQEARQRCAVGRDATQQHGAGTICLRLFAVPLCLGCAPGTTHVRGSWRLKAERSLRRVVVRAAVLTGPHELACEQSIPLTTNHDLLRIHCTVAMHRSRISRGRNVVARNKRAAAGGNISAATPPATHVQIGTQTRTSMIKRCVGSKHRNSTRTSCIRGTFGRNPSHLYAQIARNFRSCCAAVSLNNTLSFVPPCLPSNSVTASSYPRSRSNADSSQIRRQACCLQNLPTCAAWNSSGTTELFWPQKSQQLDGPEMATSLIVPSRSTSHRSTSHVRASSPVASFL